MGRPQNDFSKSFEAASLFPAGDEKCTAFLLHAILFNELVLSGRLFEHCAEIDEAPRSHMEQIVPELATQYGVTEQLKAENKMEWVRQMNACKAQAEEIVKVELIYD